jgi:hypothetical protein
MNLKNAKRKSSEAKTLALIMAVNCVRNTVIEDYHSQGKLTEEEMKAFNKEVADKLYTFLEYLFNKPLKERQAFLGAMNSMYPANWDQPALDPDLVKAAKLFKASQARSRPR